MYIFALIIDRKWWRDITVYVRIRYIAILQKLVGTYPEEECIDYEGIINPTKTAG